MKHFILSLLIIVSPILLFAENVPLKKGMIITHSAVITKATYNLNADTSLKQPLIIIEGKNITVDFNQCILRGSNDVDEPNKFYGLAVLIKKGSENIVLKNANIHRFKVAVMADSVSNITIDNSNLSHNYRQHLHSNLEREDISDWMSYHHNENNEWLRYGAGIYLKQCSNAVVKNNKITGGQCGLMMTQCESNEVYNNNFSFNSGIGIGVYRSNNNKIYHNSLDFNVRGFSFGKYSRGQDSAGILVFEQCSNNVFAYNSATHSGDGFFLWAGQYTMDTGEGGCNDNLIYSNDFSYAPTNGVEVTFSRNKIDMNDITGCDNGIWGGYSYHTSIFGNKVDSNRTGIAIEHGQYNYIIKNTFSSNETAIKLWSRKQQPPDWKYTQVHDTRSISNHIMGNDFSNNEVVYNIMGSDSTFLNSNSRKNNEKNYKIGERIKNFDSSKENESIDINYDLDYRISNIKNFSIPTNSFKGRNQIRITQWGPYNFEYPVLWLNNIDSTNIYHFEVLAKNSNLPAGQAHWKLVTVNDFKIIEQGDNHFPSAISAKPDTTVQDRFIELQYDGPAFTDAFGKYHPANKSYYFEYRQFKPLNKWNINFYTWNSTHDPNKNFETFTEVFKEQPVYSTTADKVDYTWWDSIGKNLPADSFATVATTTMNLPNADYEIGITADDLVKVFIDDKPVIDAWDAKYTELDETTHHETTIHLKGKHVLKIIHAENAGLAMLMFYIEPKH